MKKLVLSMAVSSALISGAALADITLDGSGKVVVTPADTYEIYLSGASAALDYVEQLATNLNVPVAERLCDSGKPVYKFKDQITGKEQDAYYCTLNPNNPQLVGLAGGKTNVLLYKRSEDGSAQGVSPIIADAKGQANAAITYLNIDPSICTVPALSGGLLTSTCTYNKTVAGQFQTHISDFGISDVDPEQFRGVNTPDGFAPVVSSDVGLLNVESAAGFSFGIGTTLKLRNALQAAQFPVSSVCHPSNAGYTAGFNGTAESQACMPTLTRDIVAGIATSKLDSWNDLRIGANKLFDNAPAAFKPGNQRVHFCTRVNGSGTKAQFTVNYLNYPCAESATPPSPGNKATLEVLPQTKINDMSTSGGVSECMTELDTMVNNVGSAFNNTYTSGNGRWAIGIQATEKNANQAESWRFVKMNGVAPTVHNVANGSYLNWVELTFQTAKNHVYDAGEKAIVDEFIKAAGNPVVLAKLNEKFLHSWGQGGYLASPKNYTPDPNGLINVANPINPMSHATAAAGLNNCRIPTAYNLNVPVGSGIQLPTMQ